MRIAVSGAKGGSGKTWIATNLTCALEHLGMEVGFLDVDVEEPNAHLFLRPKIERSEAVRVLVPEVDPNLCDQCGDCHEFCAFHAILPLGKETLVFRELCHSCGGCVRVCTKSAIREVPLTIGTFKEGGRGSLVFASGELHIGYPRPGPVIEAVKKKAKKCAVTILDTPPGTSCPVIQALSGATFVLQVIEATPFGVSDFLLALKMLKRLKLPFGVVLNRFSPASGQESLDTLKRLGLEPLQIFPDDLRISQAYAEGKLGFEALGFVRPLFEGLAQNLMARVSS